MSPSRRRTLLKIYEKLYAHFGPQYWWPGRTRFEIIVGAILTQNTNWQNVEKAIRNLKAVRRLTPSGIHKLSSARLAQLIRPSGYFSVKARRLKNFTEYLFAQYQGSLAWMAKIPTEKLRLELLNINGIGPETADSILLYAFDRPVFVIDAYTHRLLYRHGLIGRKEGYADMQRLLNVHLPEDTRLFNEYHALIVALGKNYCRPHPHCSECPLNKVLYDEKARCQKCYRWLGRGGKIKADFLCTECSAQ